MPPSSGELWGHHLMPSQVMVDCLMPNGVLIQLMVNRDETLERIKAQLWVEAKNYPLCHKLGDQGSYIFVSITQDAESEEFYDETRRLCDLRLFMPVLKVVEPIGNREEKIINYEIGMTIGIPTSDFDDMKDLEVMTFRRTALDMCRNALEQRQITSKQSAALYAYPPDLESHVDLPPHLKKKLEKNEGNVVCCVWIVSDDGNRNKFSVRVEHMARPIDVISEVIRRRGRLMDITKQQVEGLIESYRSTYALKVCGCDEFLLAEKPISQYRYVRECIALEKIPQFMLLTKESIYATLPECYFQMPSYAQRGHQLLLDINNQPTLSLWEINAAIRVKINCATYVNVKEAGKIYVKAGIYHGTEALCEAQVTKEVESNNPRWNEWLVFLNMMDIPRSARLCLSICSVNRRRNRKVTFALAWGNLQLFDFNDRLLNEKVSLNLWPMPQGMDELLNPIGIPGSNPDEKETACLEIEFERFAFPVVHPQEYEYEELAHFLTTKERRSHLLETPTMRQKDEETIREVVQRDPLAEISYQEKETLWKQREFCMSLPQSLPKLLQAMRWNDRENVAQMYMLLKKWPVLEPEVVLELLDCSFPDPHVRSFAVQCLEQKLTDEKLQRYLLQLVQALKFEPYLDNTITRFLLRKALMNQKIGQSFFWHLKSEMHQPAIRTRFGLVLEAFCRGLGPYLKVLTRQVEALDKLTKLTDALKMDVRNDHIEQMKHLHLQLQQPDYHEALRNFLSPLNNSNRLGDLSAADCKVMKSAKRPLKLVWQNADPMADIYFLSFKFFFKNGDDLRQDMLTLQLLRVMDSLWKEEGLDLRLIPYGCLSTGKELGLIECVRDALTIMDIQSKTISGAIQINSSNLHRWIKENNKEKYEQAIETFTRSCAGYCVATFILGIGDRHSENIMCTRDGQVFHIDFGHFLNHKKKKFGINRERVPFVLTEDFVRVIVRGSDKTSKHELFREFNRLCLEAYLVLRKHAHLLINLLTMMLSCGIPELQSLDDISYVRKTLAVEETEEEAAKYFNSQLQSAHDGQWSTKVDWVFHFVKNLSK